MKKVAAILLIVLFFFNLFGYRVMFTFMQQQSDRQLEASLDKDQYNEAELLTIKIPLSLPYQNSQENFERVNGEITVNGKILKYVKRKISDGNLILMCLPDHNKMRLQSAKDDAFKTVSDLVQNTPSKKSDHTKDGVFKSLSNDYTSNAYTSATAFYSILNKYKNSSRFIIFPYSPHDTPEQPPEVI